MNQDRVTLVAVDSDVFCSRCVFHNYDCFGNKDFPCTPEEREDGKYKIWVIEEEKQ